MTKPVRLLSYEALRERGITHSKRHLRRLEADGTFPKRVPLSSQRVAWVEAEIDDYLHHLMLERG